MAKRNQMATMKLRKEAKSEIHRILKRRGIRIGSVDKQQMKQLINDAAQKLELKGAKTNA